MTDPAKTEAELPELPSPPHYSAFPLDSWEPSEDLWDADQMRAYATAAVLQERERCAKICEARAAEHEENGEDEGDDRFLVYAKHERRCAAVIRAQKEPT
jgi:hypothetical protein